jgi:hypothetical protein
MHGNHLLEALAVADEHRLTCLGVALLGSLQQFVGVRRVARHEGNLSVEAEPSLRVRDSAQGRERPSPIQIPQKDG